MKRYVKEIYSDLKKQLIQLGCDNNKEYLNEAIQMDRILHMAERGELTNKEAVSGLITCYDAAYYGY